MSFPSSIFSSVSGNISPGSLDTVLLFKSTFTQCSTPFLSRTITYNILYLYNICRMAYVDSPFLSPPHNSQYFPTISFFSNTRRFSPIIHPTSPTYTSV